jgi:multiple sugar transport system ATP-binding protein
VPLSRATLTAAAAEGAETITLGFRPESLEVVGAGDGGFAVTVNLVEELGSDAYCYATLEGHDPTHGEVDIIARVDPRTPPAKGQTLHLRIRPGETHTFSAKTGQRLPS